jgi:hypothetical protein
MISLITHTWYIEENNIRSLFSNSEGISYVSYNMYIYIYMCVIHILFLQFLISNPLEKEN